MSVINWVKLRRREDGSELLALGLEGEELQVYVASQHTVRAWHMSFSEWYWSPVGCSLSSARERSGAIDVLEQGCLENKAAIGKKFGIRFDGILPGEKLEFIECKTCGTHKAALDGIEPRCPKCGIEMVEERHSSGPRE